MASAAEWLKFAAHLLWQQALEWDNPTSSKHGKNSAYLWDWSPPTGVMYGGEPGMHMDRWKYWYATFRTIINRCSQLEEAKLVLHYAQISMAAMNRAMGVPESTTAGADQPNELTGEVTGYLTVEHLIAEGTTGLCLGDSGTSGYDAIGDVVEGFDGLTLEATAYKEQVVLYETTSDKKADTKKWLLRANRSSRAKLSSDRSGAILGPSDRSMILLKIVGYSVCLLLSLPGF